ncbi:hypothetical protein PG985_000565 [Apiospora marii]|uniref:uncharacterized protein n=1 Tax=Apiospora marii TaxID=335849 RepID=UPI00313135CC
MRFTTVFPTATLGLTTLGLTTQALAAPANKTAEVLVERASLEGGWCGVHWHPPPPYPFNSYLLTLAAGSPGTKNARCSVGKWDAHSHGGLAISVFVIPGAMRSHVRGYLVEYREAARYGPTWTRPNGCNATLLPKVLCSGTGLYSPTTPITAVRFIQPPACGECKQLPLLKGVTSEDDAVQYEERDGHASEKRPSDVAVTSTATLYCWVSTVRQASELGKG